MPDTQVDVSHVDSAPASRPGAAAPSAVRGVSVGQSHGAQNESPKASAPSGVLTQAPPNYNPPGGAGGFVTPQPAPAPADEPDAAKSDNPETTAPESTDTDSAPEIVDLTTDDNPAREGAAVVNGSNGVVRELPRNSTQDPDRYREPASPGVTPGSGAEADPDAPGISVTVTRPWVDPAATPPAVPTLPGDAPNPFVESISILDDSTPLALEVAEDTRRRIELAGRRFPRPKDTRVLTVSNQKGGVGKTTTTVNLAAALARAGLRVMVIDIDPQGNASTALGIEHHSEVDSVYDVLVDGMPLVDIVQPCPDVENLWCAPATIDLAGAEIELVSLVARESRLQRAVQAYLEERNKNEAERLDYILIDCPPSLGLLTVNAFVAAREVLIPIQCEYYALEGLSQLLRNIELIKGHLNPTLRVSTILLTMYDGRTRLSSQVADEVRAHFPTEVLRTTVPRSVRISEAPSHGQTVMTYDPASSGALSYLEAARELAEQVLGTGSAQDNDGPRGRE